MNSNVAELQGKHPDNVAQERTHTKPVYRPRVDIVENKEELLLVADVPGSSPEHIDIRFEEGRLTLIAKVEPRQQPNTSYLLAEYGVGDFQRTFEVSEMVDATKIAAEYRDGLLIVRLPKTEAVKPRKIEVKSGS